MATSIVLLGLGIVGLGVAWYVVYVREHAIDSGLIGDALVAGSDAYRVVVAVANPATQRDLVRLAAASAHAHIESGTPELVAVNVLPVADPSPRQNVEAERLDHQRDFLAAARDIAAEMDIHLRTVAMSGRRVDETLLEVVAEEDPDQVLLGWRGEPAGEGYVFGPNQDAIVERAPCEVTLVTLHGGPIGTPVALAGPGPHSPYAARRAAEFATVDGTVPTLLTVQRPGTGEEGDAVARGEATIEDVADREGLAPGDYEGQVIVDDDVEVGVLKAVDRYETVCVGLSERAEASPIAVGTLAERISEAARRNVAVVRGPGVGVAAGPDSRERTPISK